MPDTTPKTRTITLTGRAPVKIVEADWPIVAEASGDSWDGHRGDGRYHEALHEGALDTYKLIVRQHEDGRVLVYGVLDAATFSTSPQPDWRGGVLLGRLQPVTDGVQIARAVRDVGTEGELPDHVIRECIADLPAEEL